MTVFDPGEYYMCSSFWDASSENRQATSSDFFKYWKNRKNPHEEIPASITQELAKMPTAKPAGLDYYTSLHYQLFNKFCNDATNAMITKRLHPELVVIEPSF